MRRQLLLSLLAVALGALNATNASAQTQEDVVINATNFPDEAFRNYVAKNVDENQDGKLSAEEIENVTEIDVYESGVTSLKGIEIFTNLTFLDCGKNNLTELDISQCTQLTTLYCEENSLTELDISQCTQLTTLYCEENSLTELDINQCEVLQYLYCNYNNLTELDLSKCTELTGLDCCHNSLTELHISQCTKLEYVWCYNNNLTVLDINQCEVLQYLYCSYNNLTELDLSKCTELTNLDCSYNNLIALDLSQSNPQMFYVYNNRREFDDVLIEGKSYVELDTLKAYGFDKERLQDISSLIVNIDGVDYFYIGDCDSESMPCERTYIYYTHWESEFPGFTSYYGYEFTISRFVNTIKLNASGYATYSNAEPVTINDGVTAYVAEVDEDKSQMLLKPIEGNVIPAKTGVLLKGEPNAEVTLTRGGEAAAFDRNDLRASLVEDTYYDNVYVLSGNKFVKYVGEKLTPNKAYLVMSDEFGTNTSGLKIAFFDNPTAITDVNTARYDDDNAPTYNLNGQRVSPDTKGLVIRNGRKIVNR